jgi:hypothetical protein
MPLIIEIIPKTKLTIIIGVLSLIFFGIPLLLVFENYDTIEGGFLGISGFFILMINFMEYTLIGSIIIQTLYFLFSYIIFLVIARIVPGVVLCLLLILNIGISIQAGNILDHLADIDMQCQCMVNGRSLTQIEAANKFFQLHHESVVLYIIASLNGLGFTVYIFKLLKKNLNRHKLQVPK